MLCQNIDLHLTVLSPIRNAIYIRSELERSNGQPPHLVVELVSINAERGPQKPGMWTTLISTLLCRRVNPMRFSLLVVQVVDPVDLPGPSIEQVADPPGAVEEGDPHQEAHIAADFSHQRDPAVEELLLLYQKSSQVLFQTKTYC